MLVRQILEKFSIDFQPMAMLKESNLKLLKRRQI